MVAYVQKIAQDLISRVLRQCELEGAESRIEVLAEELNRLDPRDFIPAARHDFVENRREIRLIAKRSSVIVDDWVHQSEMQRKMRACEQVIRHLGARVESEPEPRRAIQQTYLDEENEKLKTITQILQRGGDNYSHCEQLFRKTVTILDSYAGMGSQAVVRSFAFVKRVEVREIVERDYRELTLVLLPGFAWKSAVVIAGSILEAILYDLLTQDATMISNAMNCRKSPKKRDGTTRDITQDTYEDEWKLINLIDVAVDLDLLPSDRSKVFDQALREYRNFVHPRKELKLAHPPREADATLAKGALDAVCDHLSP